MTAARPRSTPRALATRHRIQTTALQLFEDRGFDGTTVADVAAAAGVSHMTFFRHFPTKEDVVLDDPYDPMLAAAVAAEPADVAPLERVRRGLLSTLVAVGSQEFDRESRQRLRLAAETPALRARIWENMARTQRAVVDVLVEQGVRPSTAEAAAGACLGAVTSALLHWAQQGSAGPGLADTLAEALEVLRP